MSVVSTHLKYAFENTCGIARGNSAKESYDYADRAYKSSLVVIQQELDKIAEALSFGGNPEIAVEKLKNFTK